MGTPDEDFWLQRGLNSSSHVREKILTLAMELLAQGGPESFNLKAICEPLFISRPLVYHYFGNQYGLMAEATMQSYARYAEKLKTDALAQNTPRARLESWMTSQAQWMKSHSGIAVIVQFPIASKKVSDILHTKFGEEMLQIFRYNMAVLATLVRGVERNQLLPLDFDPENAPYDELASDVGLLLKTSSVGFSALGASVWAAGRTLSSHQVDEIKLNAAVLSQHIRWVSSLPEPSDRH